MQYIDFLTANHDNEELQKHLISETTLYKEYAIDIGGLTFRRHIAKNDEITGMPKYLLQNRIKFGTSPVKGAFLEVKDGKQS